MLRSGAARDDPTEPHLASKSVQDAPPHVAPFHRGRGLRHVPSIGSAGPVQHIPHPCTTGALRPAGGISRSPGNGMFERSARDASGAVHRQDQVTPKVTSTRLTAEELSKGEIMRCLERYVPRKCSGSRTKRRRGQRNSQRRLLLDNKRSLTAVRSHLVDHRNNAGATGSAREETKNASRPALTVRRLPLCSLDFAPSRQGTAPEMSSASAKPAWTALAISRHNEA